MLSTTQSRTVLTIKYCAVSNRVGNQLITVWPCPTIVTFFTAICSAEIVSCTVVHTWSHSGGGGGGCGSGRSCSGGCCCSGGSNTGLTKFTSIA